MSSEADNVAILRDAYQRWHDSKAGSIDHGLNLMTDNVKFQSLAAGAVEMQFTRDSTNKDEVKHYFAGLTSEWERIYYRSTNTSPKATASSPSAKCRSIAKRPAKY